MRLPAGAVTNRASESQELMTSRLRVLYGRRNAEREPQEQGEPVWAEAPDCLRETAAVALHRGPAAAMVCWQEMVLLAQVKRAVAALV